MSKSSNPTTHPPCGCDRNCRCHHQARCRCHDYNALLALTLWDYSRALRRRLRK